MPDSNRPPQPLDYATPDAAPRRGPLFWIALTFCSISFLLLATSLIVSPIGAPHAAADRVKSAANLRSIGQCIMIYCNDNNGSYPDSFATILMNEDVISDLFINPASNDAPATGPTTQAIANQLAAAGHCSYVYMGRGLNAKTVTPDTIVAREIPLNPGDGANVLFADGHTAYVDNAHIIKIIARHDSGQFPVTTPSP
jgi:prepilin-type processing-associated H-X9-DG protein